ncbi:MAG: hypothetical protein E6G68_09120 [Actinobacteria bacterium]|nr:MAG: hypothetical protein E6G68_09120 [Actinomycetota bacterium]
MAKETCTICEHRLPAPVAFCPSCDQPTRHATDADRLEWDLRTWRAHVDRSVADGVNAAAAVMVAEAPATHLAPPAPVIEAVTPARAGVNQVIDLDRDHEFAYRACATCHETDWVLRTSRNDDGTRNYWCVRCSRSFKTEIRIPQALKPFLSAGVVLGGITAASLLMLR